MKTKADFYYEKLKQVRGPAQMIPDYRELLKLDAPSRVAELLSLGFTNSEIANILNYASAASVNAQLQRIRGQLGWQAV